MDKTKRKRNRNKNTSDTKSRCNDQPRTAESDNNNLNVNNHVAESSVSSQAQIEEIRKSLDLVTKKVYKFPLLFFWFFNNCRDRSKIKSTMETGRYCIF